MNSRSRGRSRRPPAGGNAIELPATRLKRSEIAGPGAHRCAPRRYAGGFLAFAALLLAAAILGGCGAPPDSAPSDTPFEPEELESKLSDPRLLRKLGVEEVVLLEIELLRVTLGTPGSDEPIGEMYYTIQDGWHLKAENERMEFIPGEGWLIYEK